MARGRRRSGSRMGRRSGRARRPGDWVETFESWDDDDDTPIVELAADTEVSFPLVNTYTSWGINAEDVTSPPGTYTRGLPWAKRRVLRVKGWVHFYSPDYYTGNFEALWTAQMEKGRTQPTTGAVMPFGAGLATGYESMDFTTYWKRQQYVVHSSSWTTPDDYASFRGSWFVNARMNVLLDEQETLAFRATWRVYLGSGRLRIRPQLRTYVTNG